MTHVLKDPSLAVCDASKLAAGLYDTVEALKWAAETTEEAGRPLKRYELGTKVRTVLDDYVTEYAPGVYSVEYLDPVFCARLVKEFYHAEWQKNLAEPDAAQIPELTLYDTNYGVFQALKGLHAAVIKPLSVILTGHTIGDCQSIQMARYTPDNTPHGCWHTDKDSESTLVVALSGSHEGGGTEVYMGPYRPTVVVPQLPVGHAMLFNGRNWPHQGLPVTEGVRNLLVHWFNFE